MGFKSGIVLATIIFCVFGLVIFNYHTVSPDIIGGGSVPIIQNSTSTGILNAGAVWNYATRTLTNMDNVWAVSTRTLTNLDNTRAGKIDNLDATISSRATQTSVDTIDGLVDDIKAKTDLIPADMATQLDTNIPVIKAKTDLIPSSFVAVSESDAVLNQASPTLSHDYTVLDTTTNVVIDSITVTTTSSVAPTSEYITVFVDGKTISYTQTNPTSASSYTISIAPSQADGNQLMTLTSNGLGTSNMMASKQCSGVSVKVVAGVVGGTVSNLSSRVKYHRIV